MGSTRPGSPPTSPAACSRYVRGYAWADVEAAGTRFRFVTTHLESENPEVTQAQAVELLAGPAAATAEPVVIAGDLNSDADPPDTAYAALTGVGFADTWRPDAGSGWTFGLTEAVDDVGTQLRAADRLRAGPRPRVRGRSSRARVR